jgi:CheY-like chemotaxis protein
MRSTSGEQALALFESDRFDLIITDYELPVMNCEELAVVAPNQQIALITAYAGLRRVAAIFGRTTHRCGFVRS